eukprot:scaffold9148_cov59-Phaeocystis_antarctica.AAC.4
MAEHDVSHSPWTVNKPGQHPNASKRRRPTRATPRREKVRRTPVSGSSSRLPIVAREHTTAIKTAASRKSRTRTTTRTRRSGDSTNRTALRSRGTEASCASKGCGSAPEEEEVPTRMGSRGHSSRRRRRHGD